MTASHIYLGEVSDKMAPSVVSFSHDIEEERLDIIIQSLVVQEEFGQKTQVLTVNLRGRGRTSLDIIKFPTGSSPCHYNFPKCFGN